MAAVAAALTWASAGANAAALGAITVQSALGEPLHAEIQIPQLSSEEASTFSARMAPPSAFAGAGMGYNTDLSSAAVSLQRRANGEAYLRITTNQPIHEPVLGIVIEADWASGQVTRDYTMLLDPPKRTETETASQEATAPVPAPAVAPRVRAATVPAPQAPRIGLAEQVRPAPAAQKKSTAPDANRPSSARAGSVTIQGGDTASQIAVAHGLQGVSLDQMLLAMLRANPQAFIQGNVNLIRAGAVIQMPSAEDARTVSRADARRMVVAQTEDFQAYRSGLARNVQATQATPGSQSAEGQVQPQVAETQKPPADEDRLEVSKGSAGAEEATQAAQSRQGQEQTERVAELDRNISELAELERQLNGEPNGTDGASETSTETSTDTAAAASPDPEATTESSADDSAFTAESNEGAESGESATTDGDSDSTSPTAAGDGDAADESTDEAGEPAADEDAEDTTAADRDTTAASDGAEPGSEPSDAGTNADAASPAAEATPATTPEPTASTDTPSQGSELAIPASALAEQPASVLDQIAEYRWPIVAILVALLALFGIGRSRRRKQEEPLPDEGPIPGRPFVKTAMKSKDTAAADFDDDKTRLMPPPESPAEEDDEPEITAESLASAFADSAFPLTATEAQAGADNDPVKEASVYIDYGHDEKAEELLNQALQSTPGRTEIYQELAQIHQRRNDRQALATLSARAAAAPEHAEAAWQAVAAVGRELDPDNPRYQVGAADAPGAKAPPAGDTISDGPAAPRVTLDAPFNHPVFWAETEKGDDESLSNDAEGKDNRYSPTTLDFDLNFEETAAGKQKAPAVAEPLDLTSLNLQEAGSDDAHESIERTPGTHEESLDLDIDFSASGRAGAPLDDMDHAGSEPKPADHSALMEFDLGANEPTPKTPAAGSSTLMDFDLGAESASAPAPAADSALMDFGLDTESPGAPASAADSTLMDFDLDLPMDAGGSATADGSEDPWATKLALAEEFEAIGDKEGARSMAREVAQLATGALKKKAEDFLQKLGDTP